MTSRAVGEPLDDTIRVRAGTSSDVRIAGETMSALSDPADPRQAILLNVPFFVDGLNFGDLIRVGEPDDVGIHPIEEVVVPSGHIRFLLILDDLPVDDLFDYANSLFDPHEVRMESGADGLVAVSIHPHVEAGEFIDAFVDWLAHHTPEDGDLLDRTAFSVSEPIRSRIGPVARANP